MGIKWKRWKRSNLTAFESPPVSGIGRGELKLTNEPGTPFKGGEVMGGRFTYDILDKRKGKWEVKEVADENALIRVGIEGQVYVSAFKTKLDAVMSCLDRFVDMLPDIDPEDLDPIDPRAFKKAYQIVKAQCTKMEYGVGTILGGTSKYPIGLYQLCDLAGEFLAKGDVLRTKVNLFDNEEVDTRELAIFALEHGNSFGRLRINSVDIARGYLSHPFIGDPSRLARSWRTLVRPSVLFPDVKGVVLVNKELGYSIIPKKAIDRNLKFHLISKGAIKLKIRR